MAPVQADVPRGWLSAVKEHIRASEYHVSKAKCVLPGIDEAWQAPNRAAGVRTYFLEDGIRIVPRAEAEPGWEAGFQVSGFRFQGKERELAVPELAVDGNRVEYRYDGITEWYLNDERGLEQGWTIANPDGSAQPRPPVDSSQGGTPLLEGEAALSRTSSLELSLALTGTLEPALSGDTLLLRKPDGAVVLHYGKLHAHDETGRELASSMSLADRSLSIRVDTRDATFPITIDPLFTPPPSSWTAESDQASANFGLSVSGAGDVNGDGYADVIVGAPYFDNGETDEGRAFVYHGSASGLSAGADWTAESDQAGANFGVSVSGAGDVNGDGYADVIVGAPYFDNGETDEGRAFVYHGSASGLSSGAADWTAESDQAGAYFGISVSGAGDVNGDGYADVIVGARYFDNGESAEGRAFVYHGSAAGLAAADDWTAESDQAGAEFGYSVSGAGDVNGDGYADVVVGAYRFDNGEFDEGRAFVYYGNGGPGLSMRPRQRRTDDSAPVAWGGMSDAEDGILLRLNTANPIGGNIPVKLEVEVKPLGTPFDGTGTQTTPSWSPATDYMVLSETVATLSPGTLYHWRARLLYHPAWSVQPHGRWITIPVNGWQETDFRTAAGIGVPKGTLFRFR